MIPSRPSSIGDLPEALLVEILCRISCRKTVLRCTCVSKYWLTLISDPDFGRLHVRFQHGEQNSTIGALIAEYGEFIPLCKGRSSLNLSLNFAHPKRTIVLGTCNDLVLCFPSDLDYCDLGRQHEFYIYNIFTKQSFALPRASHTYTFRLDRVRVGMGFILEYQNPSNTDSTNVEYKWSVVRFGLASSHMDIFSSETGEWRDVEVQELRSICNHFIFNGSRGGIACNGRLYWITRGISPVAIEVDPFNVAVNLINLPFDDSGVLGKSRGYLRCCLKWVVDYINVWELREEEDKAGCKSKKWCSVVSGVSLAQMVSESKDPLITNAPFRFHTSLGRQVLRIHPNNEDVLCLDFFNCIVMCNFRARTLERIQGDWSTPDGASALVLPWRPTPVPRL